MDLWYQANHNIKLLSVTLRGAGIDFLQTREYYNPTPKSVKRYFGLGSAF